MSTTEHPAATAAPMSIDEARALAARVDTAVRQVIIGQHEVVEQVLLTLLAGGHGLLQGVPGLAKTLLVKTLAAALDLHVRRIMPARPASPSRMCGRWPVPSSCRERAAS